MVVRVAEYLRILGQPVRLRLIELLTDGAAIPRELSDALGLSQQNVSKHLLSLHRAGVVSRRPEGGNVFYALTDATAVTILRIAVEGVSGHLRDLAKLASDSPLSAGTLLDGDEASLPSSARGG
jgi:DNA-binding transcriptional ArsR family regulator